MGPSSILYSHHYPQLCRSRIFEAMSNLSWFWDQHGVKVEFDGIPASYETWVAGTGQQLDLAQQMLLDAVEGATAMKIVRMDLLARNENLVSSSVRLLPRSRLTLG